MEVYREVRMNMVYSPMVCPGKSRMLNKGDLRGFPEPNQNRNPEILI